MNFKDIPKLILIANGKEEVNWCKNNISGFDNFYSRKSSIYDRYPFCARAVYGKFIGYDTLVFYKRRFGSYVFVYVCDLMSDLEDFESSSIEELM